MLWPTRARVLRAILRASAAVVAIQSLAFAVLGGFVAMSGEPGSDAAVTQVLGAVFALVGGVAAVFAISACVRLSYSSLGRLSEVIAVGATGIVADRLMAIFGVSHDAPQHPLSNLACLVGAIPLVVAAYRWAVPRLGRACGLLPPR